MRCAGGVRSCLPEKSLERARPVKHIVYVVEEDEVAVCFDDPVRCGEQERKDVYLAPSGCKERLGLHPSDNVMQIQRSVEQSGR